MSASRSNRTTSCTETLIECRDAEQLDECECASRVVHWTSARHVAEALTRRVLENAAAAAAEPAPGVGVGVGVSVAVDSAGGASDGVRRILGSQMNE